MSTGRDGTSVDGVRAALGQATPAQTSAEMLERAVFDACGLDDVALDLWQRAYDAGRQARAGIGRTLRAEYGGRSARGGWIGIALVVLAIAAVFPLASSIGTRFFDPHARVVPTAVASAAVGVLVLVCVLCAGLRALPSHLGRTLLVPIVATGIALAVNAATAPQTALVLLGTGFGGALLAGMLWFVGRMRDVDAANALDLAPERTREEQQKWLDHELNGLRREAAERIPAEAAREIVRLRTVAAADLLNRGAAFDAPSEDVPAGEVIIDGVVQGWDRARSR